MSHRGGQDPQPGYMDGVCVKISEKYKPPPRINLAITYTQRLCLNSQIQANNIPYEFSLETSVKDRIKELRSARKQLYEDKKDRLGKLKAARLKHEEMILENKKAIEDINSKSKESELLEGEEVVSSSVTTGMIYPTSYSHILTPTPLTNMNTSQPFINTPSDKSPFNISDFEADTSSPFDNMELKTLNDIEELAQVLKKEEASNTPYTEAVTQLYSNYVPLPSTSAHSTVHSNYAGRDSRNHQYSPYIPQSSSSFGPSTPATMYNNINSYHYNYDVIRTNPNQNFKLNPYNYNFDKSSSDNLPTQDLKSFNKSVPDIIKTLDNTHISKNGAPLRDNFNKVIRPNKPQEVCNERVIKSVELGDVYDGLPKNLQYLSKDVSSMGFPLSRVARACQALGDNQKKVVEHLLVMSELLDLGFLEEDVSRALLQCNNDRDKALDILIS